MNLTSKKGFGVNEIILVAAGIIIAALVIVPGLRTFATSVIDQMQTWWSTISVNIFSAS